MLSVLCLLIYQIVKLTFYSIVGIKANVIKLFMHLNLLTK